MNAGIYSIVTSALIQMSYQTFRYSGANISVPMAIVACLIVAWLNLKSRLQYGSVALSYF